MNDHDVIELANAIAQIQPSPAAMARALSKLKFILSQHREAAAAARGRIVLKRPTSPAEPQE